MQDWNTVDTLVGLCFMFYVSAVYIISNNFNLQICKPLFSASAFEGNERHKLFLDGLPSSFAYLKDNQVSTVVRLGLLYVSEAQTVDSN
jgi:hypothetical protein